MSNTIRLGAKEWTISDDELQRLSAAFTFLRELEGMPIVPDPPVWMKTPPAHVMTPARIRSRVRGELRGLARADFFETELLGALTMGGTRFTDIEAGKLGA